MDSQQYLDGCSHSVTVSGSQGLSQVQCIQESSRMIKGFFSDEGGLKGRPSRNFFCSHVSQLITLRYFINSFFGAVYSELLPHWRAYGWMIKVHLSSYDTLWGIHWLLDKSFLSIWLHGHTH